MSAAGENSAFIVVVAVNFQQLQLHLSTNYCRPGEMFCTPTDKGTENTNFSGRYCSLRVLHIQYICSWPHLRLRDMKFSIFETIN